MCKTSDPDCTLPLGVTEKISCYIEECNSTTESYNISLYYIKNEALHLKLPDAELDFSKPEENSCSKNYSVVADEELDNTTFECRAHNKVDVNIILYSNETVIWVQGMTENLHKL